MSVVYAYKELKRIKKKFILLYILNVLDIVFTLLLFKTGMFIEANVIVRAMISTPVLCLTVKVIIPLVLIVYIYNRMKKANISQLRISNIIINICLLFYTIVDLLHILWTLMYLF